MADTDIRAQLEQERHIIEAATVGPWVFDPYSPSIVVNPREENEYGDPELIADCNDCDPDAAFIAHARTALPVRNAQIEAVLELADGWEARGESDIAFSKTIDDENISAAILEDGAEMVERARHIRRAIEEAGK